MTRKEACRILGIAPDAETAEIKKRYRQIMRQVHPDGGAPEGNHAYSAQEVNLAYEILRRETGRGIQGRECPEKWKKMNAPMNPNAYRERQVFYYAEDQEGNILGSFPVARGKYLWKTEEDFPLFLLSMYQCGKELLDEIDDRLRRRELTALRQEIQPELTYLLSQQFIDGLALLGELAREKESAQEGSRIFYIPSMLELTEKGRETEKGEILSPSCLKKHRLYLKNQTGQELGYLSFLDDRLYYVIIPLFEQRRVRIKLQAAGEPEKKGRRKAGGYQKLHLWLKVSEENTGSLPDSLNLQIEGVLQKYENGRSFHVPSGNL